MSGGAGHCELPRLRSKWVYATPSPRRAPWPTSFSGNTERHHLPSRIVYCVGTRLPRLDGSIPASRWLVAFRRTCLLISDRIRWHQALRLSPRRRSIRQSEIPTPSHQGLQLVLLLHQPWGSVLSTLMPPHGFLKWHGPHLGVRNPRRPHGHRHPPLLARPPQIHPRPARMPRSSSTRTLLEGRARRDRNLRLPPLYLFMSPCSGPSSTRPGPHGFFRHKIWTGISWGSHGLSHKSKQLTHF